MLVTVRWLRGPVDRSARLSAVKSFQILRHSHSCCWDSPRDSSVLFSCSGDGERTPRGLCSAGGNSGLLPKIKVSSRESHCMGVSLPSQKRASSWCRCPIEARCSSLASEAGCQARPLLYWPKGELALGGPPRPPLETGQPEPNWWQGAALPQGKKRMNQIVFPFQKERTYPITNLMEMQLLQYSHEYIFLNVLIKDRDTFLFMHSLNVSLTFVFLMVEILPSSLVMRRPFPPLAKISVFVIFLTLRHFYHFH